MSPDLFDWKDGYSEDGVTMEVDKEFKVFRFMVTVETSTQEEAETVMCERIGPDEDYGFEYWIDWGPLP